MTDTDLDQEILAEDLHDAYISKDVSLITYEVDDVLIQDVDIYDKLLDGLRDASRLRKPLEEVYSDVIMDCCRKIAKRFEGREEQAYQMFIDD